MECHAILITSYKIHGTKTTSTFIRAIVGLTHTFSSYWKLNTAHTINSTPKEANIPDLAPKD